MSVNAEPTLTHDTVVIDGQTFAVSRTPGTGRLLVVCSDYAANRAILDGVCTALSRPTLSFDWPGMDGEAPTGLAGARLRMPARARCLMQLLDQLGIEGFDLLGMGWGGLLAQQIARDHPDRVARLVLVATSCGQTMLPGRWNALRHLARRDGLARIAVDGREARAIFGGRSDHDCRAVVAALAEARPPHPACLAGQVYAVAGFSSLAWAHRIHAATLVLAGDDDRIVPLANARLLKLLLPRAELSVLHAAGHWLLIERQAEALRRIEAFLALSEIR